MSKKKLLTGIFIGVLVVGIAFGAIGYANAHNSAFGVKTNGDFYGLAIGKNSGYARSSVNELANFLGISESQLIEERRSGKTLLEIAEAHGKTAEQLKNFLVSETDAKLQALLKEGKITKEQYENIKTRVLERVNEMINGEGMGRFGMRGAHFGNGDSENCEHHKGYMHNGFGKRVRP